MSRYGSVNNSYFTFLVTYDDDVSTYMYSLSLCLINNQPSSLHTYFWVGSDQRRTPWMPFYRPHNSVNALWEISTVQSTKWKKIWSIQYVQLNELYRIFWKTNTLVHCGVIAHSCSVSHNSGALLCMTPSEQFCIERDACQQILGSGFRSSSVDFDI